MSTQFVLLVVCVIIAQVTTKDGGACGTVVQVPYPTRSDAESAMPPAKKEDDSGGAEAAAASLGLEEEKAKEKARKVQQYDVCSFSCVPHLSVLDARAVPYSGVLDRCKYSFSGTPTLCVNAGTAVYGVLGTHLFLSMPLSNVRRVSCGSDIR